MKYEISGGARRELQKHTFNKPLTSDVMKLTSYLKEQQTEALRVVSDNTQNALLSCEFRRLAETTLAHVILFNRRRQGEVSKLTIDNYRSHAHKNEADHAEVEKCFSPFEKQLCRMFTRIEVPGKRHRCVPILLTAEMKFALDHLVDDELRENSGIESSNEYVFALAKGFLAHSWTCRS